MNEIKVNKPFAPPKEFPIEINLNNSISIFKYLHDLGYRWTSGRSLIDDYYRDHIFRGGDKTFYIYPASNNSKQLYRGEYTVATKPKKPIEKNNRDWIKPHKEETNEIFSKEWWKETLDLDEIKVVNPNIPTRFPLKVNKNSWSYVANYLDKKGYTWINGKKLINWDPFTLGKLEQFGINPDKDDIYLAVYDDGSISWSEDIKTAVKQIHPYLEIPIKDYNTINESSPINFEDDDYQAYITQNRDKIEKAAAFFNLPILDMEDIFLSGKEVILSDDIWKNLENSKSYRVKTLDDAIKNALKAGIDPKPYIENIKKGEDLPLPLVLCYGIDKYYLVGGEVILSLYRALGSIPTILQGNLNIQVKENLTNIIENKEYLTLLGIFVKFICNDLKINIPKIKIINNPNYTENNNSYGGYDPVKNQIYVVIYERTLADSMRSLCHECYHAYQNSKGILNNKSGEDGSKEENAANSYAGKIMRIFGRQHPEIFFMKCGLDEIKGNKLNLQEGIYGDYLFGDKESGVRIKWYDKELEEDTPAEKELFTRLKAYADSEFETYSNMNIDDLKPLFDKLKIEYPDIANPNLQGDSYIYRGTTTTIDKLEELKQFPNTSEDKRNIIIPNKEYSSQRQLSSWSTNYFNAASFAIATAERKGMVPLIVRAKVKDAELYFNPEFMNKLSSQPEEEVLNSTNPINVDVLIIKGFDTELYDDEYLDEIKVNQPITRPVIGKIYDIVTWYAPSDIGEIKDYNYEPYGETINGEEGWYWSKGWKWEEDNTDRELKWIDIYDPWNTREYNINEIIRLNKDNLSEIKINPISIKFPIIINSSEEFDKIKPLFIRGGYKWCNGQIIIIDDLKNESFPRKFYIRPGTDKNICSDYLGEINEIFSKEWWKETLDLDEIKVNKN